MRLYPKKLRNIEDLEREKSRLIRASRQLEKEEFLSFSSSSEKKKQGGKNDGKKEGTLFDILSFSNPWISLLVKVIQRRFLKEGKQEPQHKNVEEVKQQRKSRIRAVAVEFIGGYLKWKAIELTFKGLRYLINRRKEEK